MMTASNCGPCAKATGESSTGLVRKYLAELMHVGRNQRPEAQDEVPSARQRLVFAAQQPPQANIRLRNLDKQGVGEGEEVLDELLAPTDISCHLRA